METQNMLMFLGNNFHVRSSRLCFSVPWTRLVSMVVFILIQCSGSDALRVIGGNKTAIQGETVILPCNLIDSTETLTQISWQRITLEKPNNDNFYTVLSGDKPKFVNGHDSRFKFVGNFNEMNGSLQLSNVSLLDEGVYSCIFTLFPTGNYKTEIPLKVHVPPVIHVTGNLPLLGDDEVSLATCTAAGSRPPATVSWLTGTLAENVTVTTNSTEHANGTTTTVSSLFGVPTREINHHIVQCVITSPALSKEEMRPFSIQIHFSPMEVKVIVKSENSFQCVTEANPPAEFTWARPGQSWSTVRVEGATLQFLSMNSALNGLYQCKASNRYGKAHGYVYVFSSSGSCTPCWTIFCILLSVIFIGISVWYYKSRKCTRPHQKRQEVRTTSNESELHEAPEEASDEEHQT